MADKHPRSKTRGRRQDRRSRRIAMIRWGVSGGALVIVVGVMIWGLFYSTGVVDSAEIREGDHYRTVENPPRRRAGGPIVVTEFFSYGCIHCRAIDPLIEDWRADLADGVEFERAPVAFSPEWAILGRAYLALEQTGALAANHERIFRAIHDNARRFLSAEQVADFVDGNGVSKEAFLVAYNLPAVQRTMARNDARQRRLGVNSAPTLTVADKYVVSMGFGRRRSLQVVDHLIALERSRAIESPAQNER